MPGLRLSPTIGYGFNGAMPFQAWILRLFGTKQWFYTYFNGAMPFQAWILGIDQAAVNALISLQWGHALSGMDTSKTNGPIRVIGKLQWGHALSGMDTTGLLPWHRQTCYASMGPCPFRHGYLALAATVST